MTKSATNDLKREVVRRVVLGSVWEGVSDIGG